MINNYPRWAIKFTHEPTGISCVRSSNYFRNQHLARESALRYIKSIAYMLELEEISIEKVVEYELPDEVYWPNDPSEFRREL